MKDSAARFSGGRAKLMLVGGRRWKFEAEPFPIAPNRTLDEVLNHERLKKQLKRAVNRDFAPQRLIDSIRSRIRG